MTATTRPSPQLRVLIAGGGVVALEGLLALRRLAEERVAIELLSDASQFWYRPLAVAEPFGLGDVHGLDLGLVADEHGAGLTLGRLESVDPYLSLARTSAGAELEFDALLVAVGAKAVPAVFGAFTFRGLADTDACRRLIAEVEAGGAARVVFALPGRVGWPLPLYELALQTAAQLGARGLDTEVVIVTPEESPAQVFGKAASKALRSMLEERGVRTLLRAYPTAFRNGVLKLRPRGEIEADHVVALPKLVGPSIPGLPPGPHGFIPTDPSGHVSGLERVFAAGDATDFPVKQGGLAAQQADAAAESIALLAGADVTPKPFRPVLRGLFLTGASPLFARSEPTEPGFPSTAGSEALWWPPGKIAGRYLGPFLAERAGAILSPPAAGTVPVDVELPAFGRRADPAG